MPTCHRDGSGKIKAEQSQKCRNLYGNNFEEFVKPEDGDAEPVACEALHCLHPDAFRFGFGLGFAFAFGWVSFCRALSGGGVWDLFLGSIKWPTICFGQLSHELAQLQLSPVSFWGPSLSRFHCENLINSSLSHLGRQISSCLSPRSRNALIILSSAISTARITGTLIRAVLFSGWH